MDIVDRLKGMTDGTSNNEVMWMAKAEIQTLRAKVEVLVEAILKAKKEYDLHPSKINMDCIAIPLDEALATYDKLREENKHD